MQGGWPDPTGRRLPGAMGYAVLSKPPTHKGGGSGLRQDSPSQPRRQVSRGGTPAFAAKVTRHGESPEELQPGLMQTRKGTGTTEDSQTRGPASLCKRRPSESGESREAAGPGLQHRQEPKEARRPGQGTPGEVRVLAAARVSAHPALALHVTHCRFKGPGKSQLAVPWLGDALGTGGRNAGAGLCSFSGRRH